MSTQYANGKIVTEGLVLALDAADKNSYVSGSTVWRDISGNGNSGTLTNGPTFSNNSIVFDGIDDYGVLNSIPDITDNATFSVWVNATNLTGDRAIMSIKDTLFQLAPDGIVYWFDVDVNNLFFYGIYNTSIWYNIVITQSGTSISAYKNGDLVNTQTGGNIGSSYSNKYIGSYFSTGRYWSGNIASVQVYNRALSSQEVLQNYKAQKSRFNL